MAKQGLRSVVVKKYNHYANHGTDPDDKENLLKRDFGTETINQKWCTDITYIHVQKEGWTYLASVMDLCSRKIIGFVIIIYLFSLIVTGGGLPPPVYLSLNLRNRHPPLLQNHLLHETYHLKVLHP